MENQKNWINPYVNKINDLPELLISGDTRGLATDQVKFLRSKIKRFPKTIIELGSGSGQHLIARAKQAEDTLHIGFELRFKRSYRTAEKAKQQDLENLLVLRTNALLSENLFLNDSISGIYINFPDPWNKKRWKKHRLINPASLDWMAQILIPDGFLSYKTDHGDYFEDSLNLIDSSTHFVIEKLSRDLNQSEYLKDNIETEFESLFNSKGLPIYFLYAQKKSADI